MNFNPRFKKDTNIFFGNVATFEERYNDLEKYETLLFKEDYSVLDIGCAEGDIANYIAPMVKEVVAFDNDKKKQYKKKGKVSFYSSEFPNMPKTKDRRGRYHKYNTVLYLGVHHKLPQDTKKVALDLLIRITRNYLVIRTTDDNKEILKYIQSIRPVLAHVETTGTSKANVSPALIIQFAFDPDD